MTNGSFTVSGRTRLALIALALVGAFALFGGPAVQDAAAETNTIHVTGTGKGTVTGPGSFSCTKAGDAPQACAQLYISGPAPRTYTATPASGSYFFGWSGACTGTGACVLNGDLTATATFKTSLLLDPSVFTEILTFGYKVEIQGGGTGDGTVTGPGIDCTVDNGVAGGTCTKTFTTIGTRVYHAAPISGHVFAGWAGHCSGVDPDCLISGTGTATAHFEPLPAATPPAAPGPTSDPQAGQGAASGQAANTVDVELLDRWFQRSRRGLRLLKVEIMAAEPVHVLLSLQRRGKQLATREKQLQAGERILTLVVPKGAGKGRATLEISFEDGTSAVELTRRVRIPRR
jgi:hypothetical protein